MRIDHPFQQAKDRYAARYKLLAGYVPELYAMKAGLRRAIQLSLPCDGPYARRIEALQRFCRRAGFHLAADPNDGVAKILISTAPPGAFDRLDRDIERFLGDMFGYPRCCIARFMSRKDQLDPLVDHLPETIGRRRRFHFAQNLFLRTSPFHLYKHSPCTLDCAATRAAARTLLAVVRAADPELAALIVRFNRTPVLFTDVGGVALHLDGRATGRRVRYAGSFWDFHPSSVLALSRRNRPADLAVFDELAEAIERGDALALEPDLVRVTRGGRPVATIARPAHLHWRLLDFTGRA